MPDRKYIIRPGERVRIEISPKSKVQSPKPNNQIRRGAIKPRRENPYLARRLSGFINFYDLGYFLSGAEFETNGAVFQPAVEPPSESSENLTWNVTDGDLETYFDDLRSSIFAASLEDFREKYFRIPKGNLDFERSISLVYPGFAGELQDAPEWKAGGLRLTNAQAESLEVYPFPAMYNWDALELGAMTNLKATLTMDYAAESVPFTPSNNMDIFLLPAAILNSVVAGYANGLMTGVDFSDVRLHFDVLNAQLQLLPRDLLSDYREIYDDFAGLTDYQKAWALAALTKQFPDARATRRIREVDTVSNPTVYTYSTTTFSPNDFPFEDIYSDPDAPTNSTYVFNDEFLWNFSLFTTTDYDRLKAVIRKGDAWYYIWNTL